MLKSLLSLFLFLAVGAHAATQDVNVVNPYVQTKQYGLWDVSINNLPPNFGATQNGLWNVGQYGNWYVGQYGTWSMSIPNGVTLNASASGITITPAGGSMTVTVKSGNITVTAGGVFSVSVVAGALGGGTILPITSTVTISTVTGPTTGTPSFSLGMSYDAGTGTWRRNYLGSAGDNTSALLFPGMVGYGIYNSTGVTLTSGNAARLQFDSNGKLLVSASGGDASAANQTTQINLAKQLTGTVTTISDQLTNGLSVSVTSDTSASSSTRNSSLASISTNAENIYNKLVTIDTSSAVTAAGVTNTSYRGVSIVSSVGLSITVNNTAGAPGNVTLSTITAGAPLPVTLSTITSAAPLPVGATITAIATNLQTASGSTSGLNVALAFDYDANTSTATTKRLAPTLTTYQSTSGTATIYGSGYTLITSITVFPATIVGSKVTFFDSTVTKTTISTLAAGFYQFPRGISFGTSCIMVVTGAAFDGAVSVETLR